MNCVCVCDFYIMYMKPSKKVISTVNINALSWRPSSHLTLSPIPLPLKKGGEECLSMGAVLHSSPRGPDRNLFIILPNSILIAAVGVDLPMLYPDHLYYFSLLPCTSG